MKQPTHSGLWWFTGTFTGRPFDGPVLYGRGDLYPLEIMASDEIFPLKDFVGEYIPLSREIVERGQE
jgi:hypothetical protein